MSAPDAGRRKPASDVAQVLDSPEAGAIVIRGGVVRFAGYVAGVALSIVSAAFMIRELGVDDTGQYLTVLSLITVVALLSEAGLTNIGVREYSTLEGAARDRFMENLLGMRTLLTIAGIILAAAFAAIAYDPRLIAGTLVAGLAILLVNVTGSFTVPLYAGLRAGWVTTFDLIRQTITAAIVIALALGSAGLVAFLAAPIAANLVVLVVTIVLVRGLIPALPAFDLDAWKPILRETLPFALATAIGAIYYRVVIIIMSLVASGQQTGYFGASFRIIEVLITIPLLVVIMAFPVLSRAARDDRERLRYILQRMFDVAAIAGVWIGLCIAIGASFAIEVVAGPDFDASIDVLRIQSLVLVGTFFVATWAYALLAMRRHRALLIANAFALALVTVLTLALSGPMGAEGGAVAMVATELTLAAIYAIFLMRNDPDLRPEISVLPRVALAAAAAGGLALLVSLPDIAEVVLATIVYFVVLLAVRGIPPEVWDALPFAPAFARR